VILPLFRPFGITRRIIILEAFLDQSFFPYGVRAHLYTQSGKSVRFSLPAQRSGKKELRPLRFRTKGPTPSRRSFCHFKKISKRRNKQK
jgi:hypothetical protein